MMKRKIFVFISALLLASSPSRAAEADSAIVRGVQYSAAADSVALALAEKPVPTLSSIAVSFDLCGAGMALLSPYGQYEAALRLGIHGRYFPIAEVGVGSSNHTDETTRLHYKTNAPYFRVGMEYNLMKNPRDLGRIFIGARYGFTAFQYDLNGPDLIDPVYGIATPYSFSGIKTNAHWGEAVAGLEARIWGILRLGWSVRFRLLFHAKASPLGKAWYVPGYGKNKTTCLGGNFYVAFDI